MKKVLSLCVAVLLLVSMMPMTTIAAEVTDVSPQEIEDAIKRNSRATVVDSNGNVLGKLELDVQVQRNAVSRSTGGIEYTIICTARSDAGKWPAYDNVDGVSGYLLMVCRDEIGTSNTLISVTGNWSGEDSDTENRKVTYCHYSVGGVQSAVITKNKVPRQFEYYPLDYKGFTFKATSEAKVTETGHWIRLEVATDSSVLDQQ